MLENSFITTLAALRKGGTISELSQELSRLVARIRETGKMGSVTLKLTLVPADAGGEAITIDDEVTVKLPKLTRPKTTFFTDEDNSLQRSNPKQPDFPTMVEGGAAHDVKMAAANDR